MGDKILGDYAEKYQLEWNRIGRELEICTEYANRNWSIHHRCGGKKPKWVLLVSWGMGLGLLKSFTKERGFMVDKNQ